MTLRFEEAVDQAVIQSDTSELSGDVEHHADTLLSGESAGEPSVEVRQAAGEVALESSGMIVDGNSGAQPRQGDIGVFLGVDWAARFGRGSNAVEPGLDPANEDRREHGRYF